MHQAARDLQGATPEDVLRWAYSRFQRLAIVASFQAESSVLIDMASRLGREVEVVTIDTGRLPEETFQIMDRLRERYGFQLRVAFPDPARVAAMVGEKGPNLFLESVDLRRRCCDVRKREPLDRALEGYDAWVTGLRRDQSPARAITPVVADDAERPGVVKLAPLAAWTHEHVWQYIRDHGVPTHPLYQRGFTSIGCEPCTRAVEPGEDERAGRWWWERDAVKECGLHWGQEAAANR